MSLFTEASLVLVPSGIKDQKVYSIKPTDGSGDLTFSRASNATRVNSSGLVEKVRTNLFLYSEQFNNTPAWQYQGGATINANAGIAPNGTTTADLLYPSTNNSVVAAIQSITSTSSVEYTQSVYVKASGKNFVALYTFNGTTGAAMWVNLTTGAITNGVGTNVSGRFATSVGNGWWRIGFTDIGSGATDYMHVYPTDAAGSNSVTANGTDGILVWGAQLETGVATDYIETTSSAVSVGPVSGLPRLDYSGGASCPSLLLEPQRTNLVTYSEQFDNAAWAKNNSTATANQAVSPDGYTNADLFYINSVGDVSSRRIIQVISVSNATTYTASVFVKSSSARWLWFPAPDASSVNHNVWFDLQNGVVGTVGSSVTGTSIVSYGNGWYRCSVTSLSTSTTNYVLFSPVDADGSTTTISGSSNGFLTYGAQLEAGAYASSYIPTLSTAVTRVQDVAYKTGISSLIGQTEGTLYWEGEIKLGEQSRLIFCSDGSFSNFINTLVSDAGEISAAIRASSITSTAFTSSALTAGVHKIAFAYKANDSAFYIDGVSISGTSGATIPATSRLDIGSRLGSDSFLNSGTSQALLFPTRLSNADLATLTA